MVNLYNIEKYGFRNLVSNLFNVDSLEKIHEIRRIPPDTNQIKKSIEMLEKH